MALIRLCAAADGGGGGGAWVSVDCELAYVCENSGVMLACLSWCEAVGAYSCAANAAELAAAQAGELASWRSR